MDVHLALFVIATKNSREAILVRYHGAVEDTV
jgi:hypothetical protein